MACFLSFWGVPTYKHSQMSLEENLLPAVSKKGTVVGKVIGSH